MHVKINAETRREFCVLGAGGYLLSDRVHCLCLTELPGPVDATPQACVAARAHVFYPVGYFFRVANQASICNLAIRAPEL